jgi:hypothetical protein
MWRLLILSLLLITGCAAGLTQAEQVQYEDLAEKQSRLNGKLTSIRAELAKNYTRLTRLEKKVGARTKAVLLCDVKMKREVIGPLPFRQKSGYVARFSKPRKAAFKPKRCQTAQMKVSK